MQADLARLTLPIEEKRGDLGKFSQELAILGPLLLDMNEDAMRGNKLQVESLEVRLMLAGNTVDGPNADLIYDKSTGNLSIDITDLDPQEIGGFQLQTRDLFQVESFIAPFKTHPFAAVLTADAKELFVAIALGTVAFDTVDLGAVLPSGIPDADALSKVLLGAIYADAEGVTVPFDLVVEGGQTNPLTEQVIVTTNEFRYLPGQDLRMTAQVAFVGEQPEFGPPDFFLQTGVVVTFVAQNEVEIPLGTATTGPNGEAVLTTTVQAGFPTGSATILANTGTATGFASIVIDETLGPPGDLNGDQIVDALDIDRLSAALGELLDDPAMDLNFDKFLDERDRDHLIENILGTQCGDADLDGDVDFLDFLKLASAFGGEGGVERR